MRTDERFEELREKYEDHPDDCNYCEYCNKKTEDIFEAELDGKTVWICEDCLENEFTDECEVCGIPIHPDYLWKDHRCLQHTTKIDIFIQKIKNKVYLLKRGLKQWK